MLQQHQSQIQQTQTQMTSQQSQLTSQQAALFQSIIDMVNHMTTTGTGMGSSTPFAMPTKTVTCRNGILDSKAVMNLKSLESDKSTFRNWNDKLINALGQAIEHPRDAMELVMNMTNAGNEADIKRRTLSMNRRGELAEGRAPVGLVGARPSTHALPT